MTSNRPPAQVSPETIDEHENVLVPPNLTPGPDFATASLGSTSQASDTALLNRSSVSISMGEPLSEDVNGSEWPGLLRPPSSNEAEDHGLFVDYQSHDFPYFNEMSYNLNLPFAWMMQTHQSPSQTQHTLEFETLNPPTPNHGNLVTPDPTDNPEFRRSSIKSHTATEARKRSSDKAADAPQPHLAHVCPSFPMLEEDASRSASAEVFGHVSRIPEKAYADVRSFYILERGYNDRSFPHSRLLHAFAELYFEYFDPCLPFLHPVRVERDDLSWILLMAVAAIGSQYSEVRDAPMFTTVFHHLLRKAIQAHVSLHFY